MKDWTGNNIRILISIVQVLLPYAWFIWERGYKGDTVIKWIN